MLEAKCKRCAESFVPADENDTIHGEKNNGNPCGGEGVILGEWILLSTTHPSR